MWAALKRLGKAAGHSAAFPREQQGPVHLPRPCSTPSATHGLCRADCGWTVCPFPLGSCLFTRTHILVSSSDFLLLLQFFEAYHLRGVLCSEDYEVREPAPPLPAKASEDCLLAGRGFPHHPGYLVSGRKGFGVSALPCSGSEKRGAS